MEPSGDNDVVGVNSLAPGKFQRNFRKVIFQLILVVDGWRIACKIVLKWMPMDLTDGKSTLVQVMAWCRQVTSHYLSLCWPRSLSPYGVIRPQWVNSLMVTDAKMGYRNWPRYGLRWSGWYCHQAQHELCRPSRGRLRPRRPAQRVLCLMAVPPTTAQTV